MFLQRACWVQGVYTVYKTAGRIQKVPLYLMHPSPLITWNLKVKEQEPSAIAGPIAGGVNTSDDRKNPENGLI